MPGIKVTIDILTSETDDREPLVTKGFILSFPQADWDALKVRTQQGEGFIADILVEMCKEELQDGINRFFGEKNLTILMNKSAQAMKAVGRLLFTRQRAGRRDDLLALAKQAKMNLDEVVRLLSDGDAFKVVDEDRLARLKLVVAEKPRILH